jgi:hypothetical protein
VDSLGGADAVAARRRDRTGCGSSSREGAMGVPVPGDGLGGAAGPGGADQAAECPWLTGLTEGAFAGQAAGDGEFAAPGPPGDRRPGSATTPRSPPETPTRRAPQARQPVALPERKRHLRRSCPRSQSEPRGQPKLLAPTGRMRLTKGVSGRQARTGARSSNPRRARCSRSHAEAPSCSSAAGSSYGEAANSQTYELFAGHWSQVTYPTTRVQPA